MEEEKEKKEVDCLTIENGIAPNHGLEFLVLIFWFCGSDNLFYKGHFNTYYVFDFFFSFYFEIQREGDGCINSSADSLPKCVHQLGWGRMRPGPSTQSVPLCAAGT